MKHFSTFLRSAAITLIILANAAILRAQFITFDIDSAIATCITEINDSSLFAGYFTDITGHNAGFYYDGNDTLLIQFPGAVNTWVYGLNNLGDFVGAYNTTGNSGDNQGFLYSHIDSSYTDVTSSWLNSSSISNRKATGINDNGTIVGDYTTNQPGHYIFTITNGVQQSGIRYNNSTTLPYDPTYGNDINNHDMIPGFYIDAPYYYGFLWDKDPNNHAWQDMICGFKTRPYGINNHNEVVGDFSNTRSFKYASGVGFEEIKVDGITEIHAQDINDTGKVAGYYVDSVGVTHGFIIAGYDIGLRPNPDGWYFTNRSDTIWPPSWYNQFNYANDPYLGGAAPFNNKVIDVNGVLWTIPSQFFPDWPLFVETFGVDSCYIRNPVTNILSVRTRALNKWKYEIGRWNWGGSCYGFAATSLLAYDNMAQFISNFCYPGHTYPANLYSFPINYDNRRTINKLMISQWDKDRITNIRNNMNTKTPNETLSELKKMMLNTDRKTYCILQLFNQNPGGGGHAVTPYKIVADSLDHNIEYIYVYDNNYPNKTDRIFTIDKINDAWYYSTSVNAGSAANQWGGPNAQQGLLLSLPISTFYVTPQLPKKTINYQPMSGSRSGSLDIFCNPYSDIVIKDAANDSTGNVNGVLFSHIPNMSYIMQDLTPPNFYSGDDQSYTIRMCKFDSSGTHLFLSNDTKSFSYFRSGVDSMQNDVILYNNNFLFINPDNTAKTITVESVLSGSADEKTYQLSNCSIAPQDSIIFDYANQDELTVTNKGATKSYTLYLRGVSNNGEQIFQHDSIPLAANTMHTIVAEWDSLQNNNVMIFVDYNIDGTINDTIFFDNQALSQIVAVPYYLNISTGAVIDTFYVTNTGGTSMNWTASTDVPWITFPANNSGTDNGSVKINFAANTGAARTANVIFTSAGAVNSPDTVKVSQAGVLSAPDRPNASDGLYSKEILVSWHPVNNAGAYFLYRSAQYGNNGTLLNSLTDTLYADTTVTTGTTYYYSIKAATNISGTNMSGFSQQDDGWTMCLAADFSISGLCTGDTTYFTDLSECTDSATTYSWDINNDGTVDYSTHGNISHYFNTSGNYTVKLTISDNAGQTTDIIKNFSITSKPLINLGSDTTICMNQSVTLDAGNGYSGYLWTGGSTASTLTVDSASIGLGTHTIIVTVNTQTGCPASDTIQVTIDNCLQVINYSLEPDLKIYPNPSNGKVFFAVTLKEPSSLITHVSDAIGNTVYNKKSGKISAGMHTFEWDTRLDDGTLCSTGVYFVEIKTEKSNQTAKIMIIR